ncbi:MAG: DUF1015 domain-containing protein [Blastocatellia bacterium]
MALIKPFRALRPLPERAAAVSAVPYDVVNTAEAAALAGDNPYSFLRVSRPEIEMPEGTDIYADAVYDKAAANFDRLIKTAPLIIEDDPSFYVYRLEMGAHTQTGIVASCSVDEYDNDLILRHEFTRPDKENDRTRHMLTIGAQTGPVFLVYRAQEVIADLTARVTQTAPLFVVTADDGVRHTIWRAEADIATALAAAFADVSRLYIADGHHRAKSASRARAELRARNAAHTGAEEYNFFQCVIFPDNEARILPYNRAVRDLNGHTPEQFLQLVHELFTITENADPAPSARGHYGMYLGGRWYELRLREEVTKPLTPVDRLDVSILQNRLLAPVLGIADPRTDKRIDFVGGIRGTAELERLVGEGKAAVAFSMYATTLDDLMAVSDAGDVMPPKSTWFEPKLRDGLLSHLI